MATTRKIFIGLMTLLLALAFIPTHARAGEQLQKVTLRVDGLACPFCAYGLEKKLKRIKGLEKLDIKINDGVALLYYKPGAEIDEKVIDKKVKEAGFTPGKIEIENPASSSEKTASSSETDQKEAGK